METLHLSWRANSRHDTTSASRLVCCAALIAFGLLLMAAELSHTPASADTSEDCLTGDWITEAKAFVTEETGAPAPEVCVRLANLERLNALVLPAVPGKAHGDTVAAVYVPATREIILANDLDPSTTLARSYLVHELVHAQQFAKHLEKHVSCPGVLEGEAYGTQALYLRTKGIREEAFLLQVLGTFQSACGYSY
jgi:hypothetical protein